MHGHSHGQRTKIQQQTKPNQTKKKASPAFLVVFDDASDDWCSKHFKVAVIMMMTGSNDRSKQ